jgi:hypothetical protein
MQGKAAEGNGKKRIFHVSSRLNIMGLRDEILRMHGFDVDSAVYSRQAAEEVAEKADWQLVRDLKSPCLTSLLPRLRRLEFSPKRCFMHRLLMQQQLRRLQVRIGMKPILHNIVVEQI